MKNKNIKGFTLIELLIVISILAILMAGAYLALNPAEKQREANDARKISEFKQIQRALELYFLDHGYYPKFHFLHLKSSDATKEGFSNRLKPYINFNLNDSFWGEDASEFGYTSTKGDNWQTYGMMISLKTIKYNNLKLNDGGWYDSRYEVGQRPSYCMKKYTGDNRRWWITSDTVCKGGN